MARLESESKGGFYPTPPEEMKHILQFLELTDEAKETGITLMDPCAGEGDALKQMAEHFQRQTSVATYGIELEQGRALKAASNLDHVLACGYEETRISHEAFSIMYLNPPFAAAQGKRVESIFLDDLSKDYISAGNLLILNIPQHVLKDVAKTLANRFVNIRVYRFTDENGNYDRFKQVIVFAVRREKGLRSEKERAYRERIENDLIRYSYTGTQLIDTLNDVGLSVKYQIKPALKQVQVFKSMRIDPGQIVSSSQSCGHFQKAMGKMSSLEITSSIRNIRPALPLKTTHIAAAISAGALPESMGSHLLVGVTKRIQEKRTVYNSKSDKMNEVTTFKPKSIVRVFSDKGIFNLK
jgi:hypothetical protein